MVKAKKLKKDQDNFPLISYGNRNGLQIDLLISSAERRNAMPVYIFYSTASPDIELQIKNFSFSPENIARWCESCTNGVYMSVAQKMKDIFDFPRMKITEADLLNDSLGLSMCDLLLYGHLSPEDTMNAINRFYLKKYISDSSPQGIRHLGNNIPNYLKDLLNHVGEQPDWYEFEYEHDIGNLSGIAVVDLRN